MEGLQKRLQSELERFKVVQKDYQKSLSARQQLDAQFNENTLVKEELSLLSEDNNVYKLTGPVLIKQDLEEAKQNVQKRLDYINGEIKRQEGNLKDLDKKQDTHRENINKLQQQFQQAQVKAAAK